MMIKVTVWKDSADCVHRILMCGHAGHGEAGRDIVCAAVSALVFNAYNSIERFTQDGFDGSMKEETGEFEFHFTGEISPESKLLMDSLLLGLENIMEAYGRQYIRIRFEEV